MRTLVVSILVEVCACQMQSDFHGFDSSLRSSLFFVFRIQSSFLGPLSPLSMFGWHLPCGQGVTMALYMAREQQFQGLSNLVPIRPLPNEQTKIRFYSHLCIYHMISLAIADSVSKETDDSGWSLLFVASRVSSGSFCSGTAKNVRRKAKSATPAHISITT